MDFSSLVGVPWRDRGREASGADCWGLVLLAFQAGPGIALPSHADQYSTASDQAETAAVFAGEVGDWVEVHRGTERAFDVAALRIARGYHVGVIVRRGLFLHMPRGKLSVIEPLARFDKIIDGIFRHRRLIDEAST